MTASRAFWPFVLRWGSVIGVLIIVEILVRYNILNQYVLPRPSEILGSLGRLVTEENVLGYFAITMLEVGVAAIGLIAIGIPFGIFLAYRHDFRHAWRDWIAGLAAAPVVLMYPLFLVVFGRGPMTITMIALVTGLPPVILNAMQGVNGTREVLLNVGRSFNLSSQQQFWKIVLPSALPQIFLGLRLGLIYTMITVVAVEYLITLGGLGQLVGELAERYDLAATYAAVCFVVGVSILFFVFLEWVERWLRLSA